MVSSHCASVVSSAFAVYRIPALLTSTSSPPRRSTVSSISRSHAPAARRSAATNRAVPPAALISATTCPPPAVLRPDTTTAAPDSANSRAHASPIPLVEPVTSTTFPAKLIARTAPHYDFEHTMALSIVTAGHHLRIPVLG